MDKDLQEEERLPSAKSLGEYLKSARMAKQWNINDLVRRIKLPVYVVEVLEKDDYEAIEAKLFIKGYLRLYAKTVEANGHDFEALLREKGEFTSSLMEAKILNESVVYDPQRMRVSNIPLRGLSVVIVLGVILLAGVWWYRTQSAQSTLLKSDLFTLSTSSVENKIKENILTADSTTLPITVAAVGAPPEKPANASTTLTADKKQ